MKNQIILIFIIFFFFGINTCSQVTKDQQDNAKIAGKWKALDSTSFRGKEIEFLSGQQVILTTANGDEQKGLFEINDSTITFSIGEAPPFNMNFHFDGENLILSTPGGKEATRYES